SPTRRSSDLIAPLGGILPALAGAVAVVDVGLADPFVQRHLVDAEVLRDLRDRDAVLAGPGHSHDTFAELLGVGSGHDAHPSRPPSGQARSDVTYPCGSPIQAWRTARQCTRHNDVLGGTLMCQYGSVTCDPCKPPVGAHPAANERQ